MTTITIGATPITIRPTATHLCCGDRVHYVPPTPDRTHRPGIIQAISGVSALVAFDDCPWPQWTPLDRLRLA